MKATELQLDGLRFNPENGLIPAIVQDARSGRVLMLGYMDAEAVSRTRDTGRVTFFSRSRQELWEKGATSGNRLDLVDLQPDCDGDALLVRALPHGPTCHTGQTSCFGELDTQPLGQVLGDLFQVIQERRGARPQESYTARLLAGGTTRIAQKVAEEAVELALETVASGTRADEEAADLLYHFLVLLAATGSSPDQVAQVLARRRNAAASSRLEPPNDNTSAEA